MIAFHHIYVVHQLVCFRYCFCAFVDVLVTDDDDGSRPVRPLRQIVR